jgi:radical SAM protein with 4Fe4S-binding SPASM domain
MSRRVDLLSRTIPASPALDRPLEELAVELTVYCNLKCRMCSVWELKQHGVPFEIAAKMLRQARALGATTFTPCGAESFMRKDFLDLVELAQALGYTTQDIVTNGTMIADEHLDRLARCPSVSLHISIDGPPEVHDDLRGEGNYEKSVATARKCVERGIRVGLSGVLMRETLHHAHHLLDLAASLAIPEVSFQPFQEEISGPDKDIPRFSLIRTPKAKIEASLAAIVAHAKTLGVRIFTEPMFGVIPDYLTSGKRPIPPGGCYLPSKFLLVDFRGHVYPCFFMRTDADRMGNVYEDEIPDLWHSLHHKQLQVLALTERCPGCLAACSDVDSFGGKDGAEVVYAPPKGHAAAATSGEPSGAA